MRFYSNILSYLLEKLVKSEADLLFIHSMISNKQTQPPIVAVDFITAMAMQIEFFPTIK